MPDIITKNGFNFAFNPQKCYECGGQCCYGESGYIFANIDELRAIATFLNMDFDSFCIKYVKRVNKRFSLIEKKCINQSMGIACIFFNENTKACDIYEVRPRQCRAFPFWETYKNKIEEVQNRCIGVFKN